MALQDLDQATLSFFQQMSDVVRANLQEHAGISPTIMIQYTDEKGEPAVQWQHFDARDDRTMRHSVQLARQFAEAKNSELVVFFSECVALEIDDDEKDAWLAQGKRLDHHPDVTHVMSAQLEVPGEYFIASSEIIHDIDGRRDFGLLMLEDLDRERIAGYISDILPHNRGLKYIYGDPTANHTQ